MDPNSYLSIHKQKNSSSVIELHKEGKKVDSCYIIESEKTKRKNLVMAISWKIKAKIGWWAKVWEFGSNGFFFIINFSRIIQHLS